MIHLSVSDHAVNDVTRQVNVLCQTCLLISVPFVLIVSECGGTAAIFQ